MDEFEALAAAYAASKPAAGEGMTTAEIMEQTGWSKCKARAVIQYALKVGLMAVSTKKVVGMNGHSIRVSSYVVVTKKKGK